MLQPEINQNQTQLEHSKLTLTFLLVDALALVLVVQITEGDAID